MSHWFASGVMGGGTLMAGSIFGMIYGLMPTLDRYADAYDKYATEKTVTTSSTKDGVTTITVKTLPPTSPQLEAVFNQLGGYNRDAISTLEAFSAILMIVMVVAFALGGHTMASKSGLESSLIGFLLAGAVLVGVGIGLGGMIGYKSSIDPKKSGSTDTKIYDAALALIAVGALLLFLLFYGNATNMGFAKSSAGRIMLVFLACACFFSASWMLFKEQENFYNDTDKKFFWTYFTIFVSVGCLPLLYLIYYLITKKSTTKKSDMD